MTEELDFQITLDANPDDWHTRLLFADWLAERDDIRWHGYRFMAENQLRPELIGPGSGWPEICFGLWVWRHGNGYDPPHTIPHGWRPELADVPCGLSGTYTTRADAENAAALYFPRYCYLKLKAAGELT